VRTLILVAAALVPAAAASCARQVDAATLRIEARPISREAARVEALAAVESGPHAIQVRNAIRVPDRCRAVSGDLVEEDGALTLRVEAAPTRPACPEAEAYLAYTARIEGLPRGRYELRVVHAAPAPPGGAAAAEDPLLVLEHAVEVD
jgi:hypothetical protein